MEREESLRIKESVGALLKGFSIAGPDVSLHGI